jgi:mannose-6-phosphate isomerase-like protein (cupin superfamily)
VKLREGELVVVPRGVEHRTRASREAHVLLFEPVGTTNTGTAGGHRTVAEPERL